MRLQVGDLSGRLEDVELVAVAGFGFALVKLVEPAPHGRVAELGVAV
jgi:hypothetical protein